MYPYRVFFKKSTELSQRCKAECKCSAFLINRDLLSEAVSTFTVNQVPEVVEEGDVLGFRNSYGKTLYLGVVKSIEHNKIQCNQIEHLFDGDWIYRIPECASIEEAVYDILLNDFKNNIDPLMKKKYEFDLSFTEQTIAQLPSEKDNTVKNFKNFLYDIYSQYGIVLDIDIQFGPAQPSVKVVKKEFKRYVMSDNSSSITNVKITKEVAQYNKLLIYSKEGELRDTYYSTPLGITTDATDENRLQTIKTKVIFSDDEIETVVANHLQEQMYNHLLTFDLYLKSKIYDFDKIQLGQSIEFVHDGKEYKSILTGYAMEKSEDKELSYVSMICGKVRVTLDKKITSLLKKLALNS